jgi:hypothetical protein
VVIINKMEGYFGQNGCHIGSLDSRRTETSLLYPRKEYICPSTAAEDRTSKQEYETAETRVLSRTVSLFGQNMARKVHVSTTASSSSIGTTRLGVT